MSKNPKKLTVDELFSSNQNKAETYRIPMYQRNYAWQESEIRQLIQDILDSQGNDSTKPYYIGTLVVFKRNELGKDVYETIDGQQRLTTLTLLMAWLKNNKKQSTSKRLNQACLNLDFESRDNSTTTLKAIYEGKYHSKNRDVNEKPINAALLTGYEIIGKVLKEKEIENASFDADGFISYLVDKVIIFRVELPESSDDYDLNNYFEIMNSRGEQLEKHEVLKSYLLSALMNDNDCNMQSKYCLNLIWEACANMEKYVQTGFSTSQRTGVFGKNWDEFLPTTFDDLCLKLCGDINAQNRDNKINESSKSLSDIIKSPQFGADKPPPPEAQQRFNSVINFPNFLLQVLRIHLSYKISNGSDVKLDDKELIKAFVANILNKTNEDNISKVKGFVFDLILCRFLFDQYIIRREFIKGTDGWSLKRYKKNDKDNTASYVNTFGIEEDSNSRNRGILMLLAAFHVSAPAQSYKYWLSGALHWVHKEHKKPTSIQPDAYLAGIESLAKKFMLYRYLTPIKKSYSEIIFDYSNTPRLAFYNNFQFQLMVSCLSYSKIESSFIFNYLDYLLWKQRATSTEDVKKIDKFEFTFRSSIEHFYPQHPYQGYRDWDDRNLNSFGNLCLISHAKNASLSNKPPKFKKDYYDKSSTIDSVKQYKMMESMQDSDDWNIPLMRMHQNEMIFILFKALSNDSRGP